MITGQEAPDAGEILLGDTVRLAYVDQNRPLDPNRSIWEEISGGEETIPLGHRDVNSRSYVARFNFSGTVSSNPSLLRPAFAVIVNFTSRSS